MRYSKGYNEWAEIAERRGSPANKERAALTAAKIRDNHSGSGRDKRELARMESIAAGRSGSDDDWSALEGNRQSKPALNEKPAKAAAQKSALLKLSKQELDRLVKHCIELGKEAAEADWDANDLLDDPTPHSGDPSMFSYSVMYPKNYSKLLQSWRDAYHEQAEQFRLEEPDGAALAP